MQTTLCRVCTVKKKKTIHVVEREVQWGAAKLQKMYVYCVFAILNSKVCYFEVEERNLELFCDSFPWVYCQELPTQGIHNFGIGTEIINLCNFVKKAHVVLVILLITLIKIEKTPFPDKLLSSII